MSDFLGFFKKLFSNAKTTEADEIRKRQFAEYHSRLDEEEAVAESLESDNADKNEHYAKAETGAE